LQLLLVNGGVFGNSFFGRELDPESDVDRPVRTRIETAAWIGTSASALN
jgi:hypothetical protein